MSAFIISKQDIQIAAIYRVAKRAGCAREWVLDKLENRAGLSPLKAMRLADIWFRYGLKGN